MFENKSSLFISRILSVTNFIFYVVSKFISETGEYVLISLFFSVLLAIVVNIIVFMRGNKTALMILEFLGWFSVICVIVELFIPDKIINTFTLEYSSFLIPIYYISVALISCFITIHRYKNN